MTLNVNHRVCLVHYTSAPGGIELLMPEIISVFAPATFSVFVIRPPGINEYDVYKEVPVEVVRGHASNLKAAWRLWRYASKHRNDIFHSFNTGPFFMLVVRLARVRAAVYSIRGTQHYKNGLQKTVRKFVWRAVLPARYRIIANSAFSRELFLQFLSPFYPEIKVLYNPVGSLRIKPLIPRNGDEGLNIIYTGRLAEGKNLYRWIDMAISIHDKRPDARFFIYGDGPLGKSLADYSVSHGAGKFVSFRGFTPDLSEAYRNADLMMFLSEAESFGNAVVESILFGVPVIAADIPSIREIFHDFPIFLVSSGSAMEPDILDRVSRIAELREAVNRANEDFRIRFSTAQHAEGLKSVYESFSRD